jgi:hypothetical protein
VDLQREENEKAETIVIYQCDMVKTAKFVRNRAFDLGTRKSDL